MGPAATAASVLQVETVVHLIGERDVDRGDGGSRLFNAARCRRVRWVRDNKDGSNGSECGGRERE